MGMRKADASIDGVRGLPDGLDTRLCRKTLSENAAAGS